MFNPCYRLGRLQAWPSEVWWPCCLQSTRLRVDVYSPHLSHPPLKKVRHSYTAIQQEWDTSFLRSGGFWRGKSLLFEASHGLSSGPGSVGVRWVQRPLLWWWPARRAPRPAAAVPAVSARADVPGVSRLAGPCAQRTGLPVCTERTHSAWGRGSAIM